jgi:hypothetical protein
MQHLAKMITIVDRQKDLTENLGLALKWYSKQGKPLDMPSAAQLVELHTEDRN